MKIIITESQINNVIEDILKSENITYELRYDGRVFIGNGYTFDTVNILFSSPDDSNIGVGFYNFFTKGNKIIKSGSSSDNTKIFSGFNYVPYEVVDNYFYNISKSFLENILKENILNR
jgi:hypothetical protein